MLKSRLVRGAGADPRRGSQVTEVPQGQNGCPSSAVGSPGSLHSRGHPALREEGREPALRRRCHFQSVRCHRNQPPCPQRT
ncbi:unnamed protein product [Coccothraustes coccothraustes]